MSRMMTVLMCTTIVALAACVGRGSDPVVLPSAAGAPGTPLGNGFEVVDGTILVGDPMPLGGRVPMPLGTGPDVTVSPGPVDDGWIATSIVDGGDPKEIIESYLDQAEDAGLVVQPGTGCVADPEVDGATCFGVARTPTDDSPRSLSVVFVRGERDELVSNHVAVRYSTHERSWRHGQNRTDGDPDVPLPPPPAWRPLPSPGDRLPDGGTPVTVLAIEKGSRLAGPVHGDFGAATGGINAVLEVTGDPASVLRRYREQLAGQDVTSRNPITQRVNGATVSTLFADQPGGDHFTLTLVERPGRRTWLSIVAGHD